MIAVRSNRIRRPGHKTGDLFHLASQRFARDANSTTGYGRRNLTDSRMTTPDRTGRAKPLPSGTVALGRSGLNAVARHDPVGGEPCARPSPSVRNAWRRHAPD